MSSYTYTQTDRHTHALTHNTHTYTHNTHTHCKLKQKNPATIYTAMEGHWINVYIIISGMIELM